MKKPSPLPQDVSAEIVSVGSELLRPGARETNSAWITARLDALGIPVRFRSVAGDSRADLAEVFRVALSRAWILVATGGIGPTEDDRSREALADALGAAVEDREDEREKLRERYRALGLPMQPRVLRQAAFPAGAAALPNRIGTAPGVWAETAEGRIAVLVPGVPREMEGMFPAEVEPRLRARAGTRCSASCLFRTSGIPEPRIDAMLPDLGQAGEEAGPGAAARGVEVTVLAKRDAVEVRLHAVGADEAEVRGRLAAAEERVARALEGHVFTRSEERIEEAVGSLLRERGLALATAESCTGGLLAHRVTDIAGSSDYFVRGVVAYANEAKTDLLGVPADLIAAHGAVSSPVARAMAEGVRRGAERCVGIGITGIAGPGGGSAEKPVGTVHIAIAGPGEEPTFERRFRFGGDRETVKARAAQAALDLLRRRLAGVPFVPEGMGLGLAESR